MQSVKSLLLICLISVVLAACGGGGGSGSASTVPPDTSAPSVPQNLSTAAVSATQVTLSWSPASDTGGGSVAGYRIYRDAVQVASVTSGTTYSDTGLTPSTTFSYSVSAFDNAVPANESAQSSPPLVVTTPAQTDTSAPTVPQNLSATATGPTNVNLTWSASSDIGGGSVAGYRVYRGGVLVASVTTGTAYSDAGVNANTTYSYSVSAYDDAVPANESAQSSPPVSVTTPPALDTSPPSVPQNLVATAVSGTRVDLTWSASTDNGGGTVAGYRVYRDAVQVATVTAGTSYSDTGLSASTAYSYSVSAYDNATPANESAQSPPVSVTTPDTSAPTVPQGLNATAVSETRVDLSWNPSTDAGGGAVAGYKVYRDGSLVTLVTVTSFSDIALSGNTSYSYTVSAYDDAVPANESAQSSPPVSVTTLDTSAPSVPQNLSATPVSETRVNLSWSASTDNGGGTVAGYRVYRDTALVATVSSGTSYNDTGLSASTTYSYTVSAIDDAVPINESAKSSPPVSVTTLDTSAPTVPQNLTASVISASQVNLGWSASTDNGGGSVAGYKLYRGGALLATITSGTSYSDTSVAASTTYSYTVSAFDNAVPANESLQSSPAVSATTPVDPGLPVSYNFTSTDVSAWSQVDDSGIASNWQVSAGQYQQTVDVGDQAIGAPFDQSYKLGTYSWLPSLSAATGYTFSVDITPTADAPPRDVFDGQDVGVMFRYQNDNNYYRVSFSARESFARLEKKVGGVFTTLATDARGYLNGNTYQLVVNVSGNLIQVTRDGDPIFSVSDPDLPSGSVALYCQDSTRFDNVLIAANDPAPALVVSTPLAYSVQVGNAVTASAAVTNMPSGGSVDFRFGGVACASATETTPASGFYTADCGTPAQGDYFLGGQGLIGNLHNGSGGVVASDENSRVGIQGDRYVTVGDSITLGTFDLFSGDNQSLDGRIIGQQGFQARLDDLLTTATGYPNQVFNEGVGGDKTTDTLTRIDSILERHSAANRMLLMMGTNDSGGGTPLSQAAFQANMQSLVNSMTAQGKTVWVAKVPPVLPLASNATRNTDIQGYNTAIDSLTNIQAGPDFFGFFYDDNGTPGNTTDDSDRVSLYFGALHPNSLGDHIMADLWRNALTGATTTPFFLHRLCSRLVSAGCTAVAPTDHKQNLLEVGNETYIDAAYTLTSVPPALANGIWIQTANADKGDTASTYIDFVVDRPVTVYVAYDAGAASLPDWLDPASSSYVDAGLNVQTSDPSSPTLHVYSQSFAAGAISLGGNLATGASGANSNYLVVVVEQ